MTTRKNTGRGKEKTPPEKIKPNKLMGQHFLASPEVARRIAGAAGITPDETVLEVGAGLGALTFELAKRAKRVVAVEKDRKLFALLKDKLAKTEVGNVDLVEGDILKIRLEELGLPPKYLVVANIPYYLTSRLIRVLLAAPNRPQKMFLTIQKEVAERICASPPKMNLLALAVQLHAKPKTLFKISRGVFSPRPRVDSALVAINDIVPAEKGFAEEKEKLLFEIARAAFHGKRKTILNSLSGNMKIPKDALKKFLANAGISPGKRPQELSMADWLNIAGGWPE